MDVIVLSKDMLCWMGWVEFVCVDIWNLFIVKVICNGEVDMVVYVVVVLYVLWFGGSVVLKEFNVMGVM